MNMRPARRYHGSRRLARFILGSLRFHSEPFDIEMTQANGEPAIIFRVGGAPVLFFGVTFTDQTISELRIIGNPDKLRSLPRE